MPSGSYTDGHTKAAACVRSWTTSVRGSISATQSTPSRAARSGVFWVAEMLPRPDVVQLLTHATAFVCPSVYEPLGIVNLEAMACETAVVATHTGGIPEVVEDGVTGLLVPFDPRADGSREPVDPERFAHDIAVRMNELVGDAGRAAEMGRAGRRRAVEHFSWRTIAEQTVDLYRSLL